jgi:hypothetical protein
MTNVHTLPNGFCWGLIPQVLWAVGYGPINLDMILFPSATNGRGAIYPISDMVPSLLAEGEKPPA